MSDPPEIIVDHKAYHDQKKTFIEAFDFDDIPKQVKHGIHRMKALDKDTVTEFRRPPPKWLNHWVKLEYGNPVPLLFDLEGHPYIIAPARKKPGVKVKVLIKEKTAYDILEQLQVATDFCDHCNSPLEGSCNSWLGYSEGGGSIADVYTCLYCEKESIRWDEEFLEEHSGMDELKIR